MVARSMTVESMTVVSPITVVSRNTTRSAPSTPMVNDGMSSLLSCSTSLCRSLPAWIRKKRS